MGLSFEWVALLGFHFSKLSKDYYFSYFVQRNQGKNDLFHCFEGCCFYCLELGFCFTFLLCLFSVELTAESYDVALCSIVM